MGPKRQCEGPTAREVAAGGVGGWRLEAEEEAVEPQRQRWGQCGHISGNAASPQQVEEERNEFSRASGGSMAPADALISAQRNCFQPPRSYMVREPVHVGLSQPAVW